MQTDSVVERSNELGSFGTEELSGFILAHFHAKTSRKRNKSAEKGNKIYDDEYIESQSSLISDSNNKYLKYRFNKISSDFSGLSSYQPAVKKTKLLNPSTVENIYQLTHLNYHIGKESELEFSKDYQIKGQKIQLCHRKGPAIENLYRSSNLNPAHSSEPSVHFSATSIDEKEAQTDEFSLLEGIQLLREQIRILHQVISKRNNRIKYINDVVQTLHEKRALLDKRITFS